MATTNTNIRNLVLIGKLSITNWEAKKKDKGIETEAEDKAGSKRGTVSARKSLLPGFTSLDDIIKHSAAMRTWWNTVSAPWFDNGMRAYNVAGHMDVQMAYGDMARHRDGLIQAFAGDYSTAIAEASFALNDLFNEADYPPLDVVLSKFTCNFEFLPLPNTDDFRIIEGLSDEDIEALKADAESKVQARVAEASRTAIEALHKAVVVMADRLKKFSEGEEADLKGNKFYDSWVDNVRAQAALMPQLNITNDPALAALAAEAATLVAADTATFKFNHDVRATATEKANDIGRKLRALFAD